MFGPVTNSTLVIAIQVHHRLNYLRHLIISLSEARSIDRTLLIFSHDVWNEDINKLIRSIDFAMVLQIHYPYSLQTHPYTFPGESSRDCPRNIKPDDAAKLNCINKDWPDLYGHYREAKFTQTKHHWWWKSNQIFGNLKITADFTGTVLFLEEDHFVTEDFIHVLKLMEKEQEGVAKEANILCLGTYLKKFNYKINSKQAELTQWMSSKHNMGMALTRKTWNKILQCTNHFCRYDDYNWDWSLLHVSLNCLRDKLQTLMVRGPRVFHIGECGVHHKKKDCATSLVMNKVKYIIDSAKQYLFPDRLTIVESAVKKKVKLKKGNGGWGDKRDHSLCLNMTLGYQDL
ncbi:alpha-1,6-mannosyl-glycoprotein 2-beta-N-acetylglucosaminyltransferase isoform X2 [Eurytemora carolleeae]|uniref:alpha-1,6-mannosyl-glycoprotein 2-beta-N-acetylglucosaminyltransferase isoform X2 n=1 Tax=Eurytemora carolleeae TaxID=1294199 RepID=UPI000C76E037|nr:alpha-1,6-mannosyl-glycoprotein 2-beta-N-acetylglucosaminyltransferase isoform X2 [Eurytemora carolleeae]|eukprot:XP_023325761.1 alpha-1,6-mannosyl-glycoprotein 2-beta-N-acetylglucosaminyltransferase-like isoform X2 [Eurytemora affinis]